jgi:hypothetical protein
MSPPSELDDALDGSRTVAGLTLFNQYPATPAEVAPFIDEHGAIRAHPAAAAYGLLIDQIIIGPTPAHGNRFPISTFDCIPVPGNTPSICPNADRKPQPEWLPLIEKRFREMGIVCDGQTIHWVGSQSKSGHVCGCFRANASTGGGPPSSLDGERNEVLGPSPATALKNYSVKAECATFNANGKDAGLIAQTAARLPDYLADDYTGPRSVDQRRDLLIWLGLSIGEQKGCSDAELDATWRVKLQQKKHAARPATVASLAKVTASEPFAPAESPRSSFMFAANGDGYFVAGFGEQGHVQKLKGFDQILRLIRTPGRPVPMIELAGGRGRSANRRRCTQPAAGSG